jgi:tRNA threonylcarbamoyladenosine biosynthesis protein TsaE
MQKNTLEYIIKDEFDLKKIIFQLTPGDRIFFYGDLGVWKSTFIRYLLREYMKDNTLLVRSPTYTYYQKYNQAYHFDLYRLEDYLTWISIGGEEIQQSLDAILLIEWPGILENRVTPTKIISIEIIDTGDRKVTISSF